MTDCYRNFSSSIVDDVSSPDTPCGNTSSGFSPCCRKGAQCLQDNICHFTSGGMGTSGYYVASCTDRTGNDLSCQQTCNESPRNDIVYIEADSLWHCCEVYSDTEIVNCSIPTDVTFQAPAPENLLDFAPTSMSASTSTSTSMSTSTSTSAPHSTSSSSITQSNLTSNNVSSTPTPSSTPNSNSGLSTGAKAGIGIGVTLGAICIILLSTMIFLMMKRQRRQQQETIPPSDGSKGMQDEGNGGENTTRNQQGGYELQGQAIDSELDPSRGAFHEVES